MSAASSRPGPVKILVTNVHSVRNSGDHVLLQVALEQLYRRFPGAEITIAMNDPGGMPMGRPERIVGSFTHWFRFSAAGRGTWRVGALLLAPWWLLQSWLTARRQARRGRPGGLPRNPERRDLLRAYCQADVVVSCAGNFLYSSGLLRLPLLLHLLALVYGQWAGKPVYMLPQTVGPFRAGWEVSLVQRALAGVRVVMLRDALSLETLAQGREPAGNMVVLPDIAFLYRGHDAAWAEQLLQARDLAGDKRPPLLGVTLINWQAQHGLFQHQERYEAAVAAAVRTFVEMTGGTTILFAQVYGPTPADDDRVPARRVAARLADLADHLIQPEEEMRPEQLKAGYGAVDIFLGSRLHSNIFALGEGTPVLAIAYQYKTHGVMQMLGLGDWVIDIEEATAARVTTALERLWEERRDVREQVRRGVAAVQADAARAVALIQPDSTDQGAGQGISAGGDR